MSPIESLPTIRAEDRSPATSLSASLSTVLRNLTPARVGLQRTGVSLKTSNLLDFQLAHARARDAVHATLQPSTLLSALKDLPWIEPLNALPSAPMLLHSAAKDRQTYLQRPDLGRKLDSPSRDRLLSRSQTGTSSDLSILIVDGLSALAVERHAIPLLVELLPALHQASQAWTLAPPCIVQQGRVAIGDEVGQLLSASLVLVLIGERPGLSSPDSLGAYITWQPRRGRTDAERNCISNIRAEGLSYSQAAHRLYFLLNEARRRQLSGVNLKESAPVLEAGQ